MSIIFKNKSIFSVNTLIAVALALSTFTQIRFSKLPIGVSDLFFLSYILYSLGILSISKGYLQPNKIIASRRKQIFPIFAFNTLYLLLLFAGTIYAYFLFKTTDLIPWFHDDAQGLFLGPYHNLLAFSYLFIIFLIAYIKADLNLYKVSYYTVVIISVLTSIFFIISLFRDNIFGIKLFYLWTDRMMLFTKSPNHLADFIAPIPFFLIYFFKNTKSFPLKICHIILFLIVIAVGLQSQSKATVYGWGISFSFLLIYYFLININVRYFLVTAVVLFSTFLIINVYLNNSDYISQSIENISMSKEYSRDFGRIIYDLYIRSGLFFNSLEAGSISPYIGLGSGASSGITEPFMGRESHNHISEVFMTTGYLGLFFYLCLMFYIFYRINFSNQPILLCAFLIISVTSLFHFQLRQPLFWFYLLFLINLSDNAYSNYQNDIKEL